MNTRQAVIDSPLGELTVVAADQVLTGVYFRHHWRRPAAETLGSPVSADDDAVLNVTRDQLTEYLDGRRATFDLPTKAEGTTKQRRVWDLLAAIPYGETVTYGELARVLDDGTTAQEVGQTVGRNPLSIVVPCHRVVGRDGRLTGYAGGLKRKQYLLELEEPADARAARLF